MGRPIKKSFLGNIALAGSQIVVRVKVGANAEAVGFIVKQKGSHRYIVSDGVNVGICKMVNLADGSLTDNTMTLTVQLDTAEGGGAVRVRKLTNRITVDFAGVKRPWSFSASLVDGKAGMPNS